MLKYPNIDPVIFEIGPISLKWYGVAYVAGILLATMLIRYYDSKDLKELDSNKIDDFVVYLIIGIIAGGRMGYVIFYGFEYYSSNPLEILKIWEGGMSFHGGLMGVVISAWIFSTKNKINKLYLADLLCLAAPIGLFFGRIANFINGELYGRVTQSKFGMIFPNGGLFPRHPSQLYEAFFEGLVLFILLNILWLFKDISKRRGLVFSYFLMFYGVFRFWVENFRQPDANIGLLFGSITMGQLLTIPIVFIGLIINLYVTSKLVKKSK